MLDSPLVSVLMTAFNREKFIGEAIESVLRSTYNNFELIIVDDCSVDKTLDIARNFERKDDRIFVYSNDRNLGDYANRNIAASYAKGKYLKYLDSDDLMSDDCLEIMVFGMEVNSECAFGVSSRSVATEIIHMPKNSYRVHFFQRGILDISPSGSIIRNNIFKVEQGFLELRCVSDFEFWLRLALKYPLIEFRKDLIFWREHEDQEIRLGNLEYLKYTIAILSEKLQQSELSDMEKHMILAKYKKNTMRYLIRNCMNLGFCTTYRLMKMNQLFLTDVF